MKGSDSPGSILYVRLARLPEEEIKLIREATITVTRRARIYEALVKSPKVLGWLETDFFLVDREQQVITEALSDTVSAAQEAHDAYSKLLAKSRLRLDDLEHRLAEQRCCPPQ